MEVKPGYKQTEVGVIPDEWDVIELRLVTTQIGDGLHGTPVYSLNGSYYFINGNNLSDGRIVLTNETHSVEKSEFVKHRKPLGVGSILMSINGTIGNLALFDNEPVVLGKSVAFLNVSPRVSKYFIYHTLQAPKVRQQFFGGLTGSTIGNLGLAAIRGTKIPFPPTEVEQHAIAEALSDVDDLLAGLDRLIAKKHDLKRAAMQQLLTGQTRLAGFDGEWELRRLGDIAVIAMGQSPDSKNYNRSGDGVPLIQGNADIENRRSIARVWTTQITKEGRAGDLLLTVRAPVGAVGRISERCCLGRGVCSLRTSSDAVFLFHALVFGERDWKVLEQGSTFTSANATQVAAFTISMPTDVLEQTAIAEVLTEMDAELAAFELRRQKTRALKQAMMQELLTGRTRLVKPEQLEVNA
jgi:type I restriction enzyme, S subunit